MKKILSLFLIACCVCTLSAQKNNGKSSDVSVAKITQEEFKQKVFDYQDTAALYKGKKAVIVDFYADWCGPCRRMAPLLDDLAKEYASQIVVYKINVDENKEIARQFDIRNIPTLLLVKPKQRPMKAIGGYDKSQLREIITTYLLDKPDAKAKGASGTE